MASKPEFDDLLDDTEDSQVIDVDEELQFDPNPNENAGVVAVEPEVISIGRGIRKREMQKLQKESK
jgi:hypothetical protein